MIVPTLDTPDQIERNKKRIPNFLVFSGAFGIVLLPCCRLNVTPSVLPSELFAVGPWTMRSYHLGLCLGGPITRENRHMEQHIKQQKGKRKGGLYGREQKL